MEPIIEIKNLTHIYSPHTPFEQRALDQVNLTIYRGEYLGIIGRTGSGKSTLIQHLNGLIRPTEGKVLFQGQDIWSSKELTHNIRFQVGLVFQYPEYQLFEETVAKDIAFGPRNMGLDAEEIDRRVRGAMLQVGLNYDEVAERSPFELSGGQMRRVAIAGVLAMRPRVLILDEPTAGLDPAGRNSILQMIRDLHAAGGLTVIMVSHSMDDISTLATRLVVMSRGELVMTGTPREVFTQQEKLRSIGLGVPQAAELTHALIAEGFDLPGDLYTLDEVCHAILALKKEGRAC